MKDEQARQRQSKEKPVVCELGRDAAGCDVMLDLDAVTRLVCCRAAKTKTTVHGPYRLLRLLPPRDFADLPKKALRVTEDLTGSPSLNNTV